MPEALRRPGGLGVSLSLCLFEREGTAVWGDRRDRLFIVSAMARGLSTWAGLHSGGLPFTSAAESIFCLIYVFPVEMWSSA